MSRRRAGVSPDSYVVATIPRSLEASARGAIAALYQPFFVEWAEEGIVLVIPAAEWNRVAARLPGATTQPGFRLIALEDALAAGPPGSDGLPPASGELAAVVRALGQRGLRVRTLRSFYRDHLLVVEEDLAACLEFLAAPPPPTLDPASGG